MKILIFIVLLFSFGCRSKQDTVSGNTSKPGRKKVLTGVIVTGIDLNGFPKYAKDGELWDAYAPFATDPDLFAILKWNENELYRSEIRNECAFGTPISFAASMPFRVKPFDQKLLLEVFDEDGISSNDNLGYFSFLLKDYQNKKTIELHEGELVVVIHVEWIYE